MSMNNSSGQLPGATSETKSARKKKKKGGKDKANGEIHETKASTPAMADKVISETAVVTAEDEEVDTVVADQSAMQLSSQGESVHPPTAALANGAQDIEVTMPTEDRDSRFGALVKDRDTLRMEVTQLRESLEELQAKHQSSLASLREELQGSQLEKEHAEEQYQNLLGKVNTIKAQLGERLKADAADLAQARSHIESLEEENSLLQKQQSSHSAKIEELGSEKQAQAKELSSLRNRSNLSQQSWLKEREDLVEQEAYTREQFQNAEQAMREWEVLALEERSIRKDLGEKMGDLEEQLVAVKEAYERAREDRDSQSTTVDGLQKALQEIQVARRKELREVVESSQAEANNLRAQLTETQSSSTKALDELATAKKELERALPFEKEVKEKNLLIGKLRHEAVTLNEHLTKALRFLRRGKPEDNVDRQLVTNHLLHFLTLDRSDPKKFQILQLIAALLAWSDEQREQAGLSRPGGGATANTNAATSGSGSFGGSLRLPNSPLFHRTPSTPSLSSGQFQDGGGGVVGLIGGMRSPASKESLAELWQGFLEQESGAKVAVATPSPKPNGEKSPHGNDKDEGRVTS